MIRRLTFLVVLCSGVLGATAAPASGIALAIDGGHLEIRPLLDNAVRVRFTRDGAPAAPSLVLTGEVAATEARLREQGGLLVLELPRLRVTVDRTTAAITFTDPEGRVLLSELPGTRRLERGMGPGETTWSVGQCFDSPAGEHLFGLGQFQDGHLDVRDLPRRLTQVNTQIAIPMLVSSRGYGLLWHNYGLTEFNPADGSILLTAEAAGMGRPPSR